MIVTPTGHIKGPVAADTVHIAGCIMGDVMARDHMRLEKTGFQKAITNLSFS